MTGPGEKDVPSLLPVTVTVSLADVMASLGLSCDGVMSLIASGELPASKLARQWAIDPADVHALLERHRAVRRVSNGWLE